MASFAVLTLTISYLVSVLKFDPGILRIFAVLVIGFLGLTLVVPVLSGKLEAFVSRVSGRFGNTIGNSNQGFGSGFAVGAALGIVWTPCAGPILATIATLAATKTVNFGIVIVTVVYIIGVGIPLFFFALASSHIFNRTRILNKYTAKIQQVFGIVMILTALAIYTNYDKVLQAKLLDAFPSYSIFLNQLETSGNVQQKLDELKKGR